MNGRDAVAQAAFYADPVDVYSDARNVSNAQILLKKRAAILSSEGLWTVTIEKLVVKRQSDDTAVAYLVKHYEPQTDPPQISEQFVSSRLQLKRFGDSWKIVSEQDLSD